MKIKYFVLIIAGLLILLTVFSFFGLQRKETTFISKTPDFVYKEVSLLTNDNARRELNNARLDLEEMNKSRLGTYFVNDKILEAEYMLGKKNEKVFEIVQLISYTKQKAFKLKDVIPLIYAKEKRYSEYNLDLTNYYELKKKMLEAFDGERFNEAEDYLIKAETELESKRLEKMRYTGVYYSTKNFFAKYGYYPLILIVLVLVLAIPAYKRYEKYRAKKKLELLGLESKTITEMMKKIQEDCYVSNKISLGNYNIRNDRYNRRMAEIKREIPVLKDIIEGKSKSKKK